MKTSFQFLLGPAVVLLLLSAGCATASKAGKTGPTAIIESVEGISEKNDGKGWEQVRAGHLVREGDSLRTGADSSIEVSFGEYGGIMRLTPESQIRLERFDWADRSTGRVMHVLIDLQRGRIRGDTLNPAPNTQFQVKTLRGTTDLK